MRAATRSSVSMFALAFALTALVACSRSSQFEAAQAPAEPQSQAADAAAAGGAPAAEEAKATAASRADAAVETDSAPTAAQVASSAATHTDAQRRFIRTAQAQFRVRDVYKSALAIEDVVAAQGGFVVRNHIASQDLGSQARPAGEGKLIELTQYTVRGELTVRVPSANTQAFLRAIVNQMEFLQARNFEARDAQFELLRQQLAWQRAQETQRDLGQAVQEGGRLGQKVDAVRARGDARAMRDEALVSQKEFEDRVAFSTIDLTLFESTRIRKAEQVDVEAVFAEHGPGFFARLGSALRAGWHGALDLAVVLAQLWPLWLVIAAGVLAYRRLRKLRRTAP